MIFHLIIHFEVRKPSVVCPTLFQDEISTNPLQFMETIILESNHSHLKEKTISSRNDTSLYYHFHSSPPSTLLFLTFLSSSLKHRLDKLYGFIQ